jgi:hypothetical protein
VKKLFIRNNLNIQKEKIAQFFMVQEQRKNKKEKNADMKSVMLYI